MKLKTWKQWSIYCKVDYENHFSIIKNKNSNTNQEHFGIPATATDMIYKIFKELNAKRATRPDKTPPKTVKVSVNTIDCHLTNIVHDDDIAKRSFSVGTKISSVRPTSTSAKKLKTINLLVH